MRENNFIALEDAERAAGRDYVPAYTKELKALTGAQLLTAEFPSREMLLAPWLPQKGLAMVYAERGIGIAWIAQNVSDAIAAAAS